MQTVLRSARHDQVVGSGRDLGLVRTVDIERFPAVDRPEGAAVEPDAANPIGEPSHGDGVVRWQRQAPGLVVQPNPGGNNPAGLRVANDQPQRAGRLRRTRRPTPGDAHVAQADDALAADNRQIDTLGALSGQTGAIELHSGTSVRAGFLRGDVEHTSPVATVLVEEHHHGLGGGELRHVAERELDAFVDVEAIRVVDVEPDRRTDEALLPCDVANHRGAASVGAEIGVAERQDPREALLFPVQHAGVPGIVAVGGDGGDAKAGGGDGQQRSAEHAQNATRNASCPVRGGPAEACARPKLALVSNSVYEYRL